MNKKWSLASRHSPLSLLRLRTKRCAHTQPIEASNQTLQHNVSWFYYRNYTIEIQRGRPRWRWRRWANFRWCITNVIRLSIEYLFIFFFLLNFFCFEVDFGLVCCFFFGQRETFCANNTILYVRLQRMLAIKMSVHLRPDIKICMWNRKTEMVEAAARVTMIIVNVKCRDE